MTQKETPIPDVPQIGPELISASEIDFGVKSTTDEIGSEIRRKAKRKAETLKQESVLPRSFKHIPEFDHLVSYREGEWSFKRLSNGGILNYELGNAIRDFTYQRENMADLEELRVSREIIMACTGLDPSDYTEDDFLDTTFDDDWQGPFHRYDELVEKAGSGEDSAKNELEEFKKAFRELKGVEISDIYEYLDRLNEMKKHLKFGDLISFTRRGDPYSDFKVNRWEINANADSLCEIAREALQKVIDSYEPEWVEERFTNKAEKYQCYHPGLSFDEIFEKHSGINAEELYEYVCLLNDYYENEDNKEHVDYKRAAGGYS